MSHGPNKLLRIARRVVKPGAPEYWWKFVDEKSGWSVIACYWDHDYSFKRGFCRLDRFISPEGETIYITDRNFDAPTLKALNEFKPKDSAPPAVRAIRAKDLSDADARVIDDAIEAMNDDEPGLRR